MRNNQDRGAFLGALFAKASNDDRSPYVISCDVAELRKAARSLEALAIADCNYGMTSRQQSRRDKLRMFVVELATDYGFRAECHGDPRGLVVKLFDPADDSAGDGFGGGWGVY